MLLRYQPQLASLLLFASVTGSVIAAEPLETFRRDIQPILAKYCYDCHGNGVDKGGVRLDEFETAASLHDPKLWLRALKNVRSGLMPPLDEEQLPSAAADK